MAVLLTAECKAKGLGPSFGASLAMPPVARALHHPVGQDLPGDSLKAFWRFQLQQRGFWLALD